MTAVTKKKPGPNQPCPCGSGKKHKKCCRGTGAAFYLPQDRLSALEKLDDFVEMLLELEEEDAYDRFWGRHLGDADKLPPELAQLSIAVQETWFAFDFALDDDDDDDEDEDEDEDEDDDDDEDHDVRAADMFLEQHPELTAGERAFLITMRRSSMRLYEVIEVVPGTSLTLRDLVEGERVRVNERMGSRTIGPHEWIAARVVPRGPSGGPEMEAGVLHIPRSIRESVLAQLKVQRSDFLREHPGGSLVDFYKETPPFFHDAWASSIFEPPVPELRNTDGEPMIVTRVSFHVDDAEAVRRALDGAKARGVERRMEDAWSWAGDNAQGEPTSLGTMRMRDGILHVETNSVERGDRGRALVESLSGSAIRHRGTTHEDLRRTLQEKVRAKALGLETDEATAEGDRANRLPAHVQEALVAQHYAGHYRAWIDEGVPALDGKTPREAARDAALRPKLVGLLHDLEGFYQQALRSREPAYDPSWMWNELGLDDPAGAAHPPPLAHERVAERVRGAAEVSRAAAERLRKSRAFSDQSTVLGEQAFRADLELQRFLRAEGAAANESGAERAMAAPYLRRMVNFDLHRRKAFWVDASLSYMLGQTDVDVVGRDLRVPFPSFCLVFTDRHALSLCERTLSQKSDDDPLVGHILRVATVYVTEEADGDARRLDVCFALDALGADLPSLVRHEIPLSDDVSVRNYLDSVAPHHAIADPEIPDASPVRGMLRLVINAILYATSAGVEPETRTPPPSTPRSPRTVGDAPITFSSDEVYFLPGKIEVSRVRRLQELERAPGGRLLLRRFMVRGHWRRPPKTWSDPRLRWVEPYWKGPEMAAVIERAYRLKDSPPHA